MFYFQHSVNLNAQRYSIGMATREGYVKHGRNEDAIAGFDLQAAGGLITFALVADDIGENGTNEAVSQLVIEAIRESLHSSIELIVDPHTLDAAINRAVQQANLMIPEQASQEANHKIFGTSLALAAIGWGQLQIAHLGNSRLYLQRDDKIHRLTVDHSWGQGALDSGMITARELARHPNRNVVNQYLGCRNDLIIDRWILLPKHFELDYLDRAFKQCLPLRPADQILLCSDGLSGCLSDDELLEVLLQNSQEPSLAAQKLVDAALARKVKDNTSAVILASTALIQEQPRDAQPMLAPSKPPQLATVAGTMVSLLLLLLLGFVYFVDMIPSNILITQNVIADDTSKPDNDAAGVVLGPARIENIAPYPAKTIYRTKTDLKDRLIVTEGTVGHMSSRGFLLADDAKGH